MSFLSGVQMTMLFIVGIFMILLVLIQRGKGGGLTGALGGMGGQSAFGTKAGDLFTRITIGAAVVWILLCVWTVTSFNKSDGMFATGGTGMPGAGAPGQTDVLPDDSKSKKTTPSGETAPPAKTETAPSGDAPATTGTPPAASGDAPKATGDAPKGDAPKGDAPSDAEPKK